VRLQKGAIGRLFVDVTLVDVELALRQKTSGVPAGRSSGLPEEGRLGHGLILDRTGENELRGG
jgi:hypothetical protein